MRSVSSTVISSRGSTTVMSCRRCVGSGGHSKDKLAPVACDVPAELPAPSTKAVGPTPSAVAVPPAEPIELAFEAPTANAAAEPLAPPPARLAAWPVPPTVLAPLDAPVPFPRASPTAAADAAPVLAPAAWDGAPGGRPATTAAPFAAPTAAARDWPTPAELELPAQVPEAATKRLEAPAHVDAPDAAPAPAAFAWPEPVTPATPAARPTARKSARPTAATVELPDEAPPPLAVLPEGATARLISAWAGNERPSRAIYQISRIMYAYAFTAAAAVTRIRAQLPMITTGSRPSGNCFTYWLVGCTSCASNILTAVIDPSDVHV